MNGKQSIRRTFLCLTCLVSLMFTGCNDIGSIFRDAMQNDPEVVLINTNVVTANTQFGFNLFNDIRKTEQNRNIFISPFSVSVALAMTLNGASGETEQAMTNTLQLQGLDCRTNKHLAMPDCAMPFRPQTRKLHSRSQTHSGRAKMFRSSRISCSAIPNFSERRSQH